MSARVCQLMLVLLTLWSSTAATNKGSALSHSKSKHGTTATILSRPLAATQQLKSKNGTTVTILSRPLAATQKLKSKHGTSVTILSRPLAATQKLKSSAAVVGGLLFGTSSVVATQPGTANFTTTKTALGAGGKAPSLVPVQLEGSSSISVVFQRAACGQRRCCSPGRLLRRTCSCLKLGKHCLDIKQPRFKTRVDAARFDVVRPPCPICWGICGPNVCCRIFNCY